MILTYSNLKIYHITNTNVVYDPVSIAPYFEKNISTDTAITGNFTAFMTFTDGRIDFEFKMGPLGTGYDIVSDLNVSLIPSNKNITVYGILDRAYLPLGIMFTWDGKVIAYKAGPDGATQNITIGSNMYCSISFDLWVGNGVE